MELGIEMWRKGEYNCYLTFGDGANLGFVSENRSFQWAPSEFFLTAASSSEIIDGLVSGASWK